MDIKEYDFMVSQLLKRGADILATMTPEKVNMLHCAIGLSGEVAELFDANVDDRENILEELGDIDFYLSGLFQSIFEVGVPELGSVESDIDDLVIHAGTILDQVKKYVVYNKPLDIVQLENALLDFVLTLDYVRKALNFTKQECIDANAAKLAVRYKGGYSDQAAQDRADKQ